MALAPPVPGATITQRFGVSGLTQEYHYWHVGSETAMFGQYAGASYAAHFHAAIDLAAPAGTPVLAPEASTIVSAGWAASPGPYAGGGIMVEGRIAGGMRWAACHLQKTLVVAGQRVARGQRIGLVDSTGNSTGNHVHFPICTMNSSGARLFRNPDHFLPGGKYANSALIKPAGVIVNILVAVNGAGINLRGGPSTNWASVYISKPDGIYRTKDNVKMFSLATGFIFVAWEKNQIGEVWAQLKTGSGQVIYARSDLIHAIRGTLPAKP